MLGSTEFCDEFSFIAKYDDLFDAEAHTPEGAAPADVLRIDVLSHVCPRLEKFPKLCLGPALAWSFESVQGERHCPSVNGLEVGTATTNSRNG